MNSETPGPGDNSDTNDNGNCNDNSCNDNSDNTRVTNGLNGATGGMTGGLATIDDLRARGFTDAMILELVKDSAISPTTLIAFGVRVIFDAKEAAKQFGWRKQDWEDGRLPAWAVDAFIPFHRDAVLSRCKPARPFEIRQRDGSAKLAKYAQPKNSGVHIFYGVSLRITDALTDVSVPIWITEGEKKCMAAESAGLCCIALFGVNQWHLKGEKTLHPELAHVVWVGRIVFLGFDRDATTNYRVRKEELALARVLEAAGAIVRIVRFPEDAPKLDDFLARHERTELAELIADAMANGKVPPDTTAPDEAWRAVFDNLRLDATTGRPIKDTDTVVRILKYHPDWAGVFGFDVRGDRQLFLREPPFPADVALKLKTKLPREVTDSDVARVSDWLAQQPCLSWKTQPGTTQMENAVRLLCEMTRVDTVKDYLLSLKWDGVPRLDRLAVTHFGAPDTPYSSTILAKWFLSAVARARDPGCQVDHVIILEGPQGIGKSTSLRIIAVIDAHFSDCLPHDVSNKDAADHLRGPWIVELGELAGLKRAEVETIKAFVSRRFDKYRPAYGRRTVTVGRRCVFAGTTNESQYLRDQTGDRRYWPLSCSRIDLEGLLRDRDQIWAEALERIRAGESWHIEDAEMCRQLELEREARRERHPWEDQIPGLLLAEQRGPVRKLRDHVTVFQVLRLLGANTESQAQANTVARILGRLGWVRARGPVDQTTGTRPWIYKPPLSQSELGQTPVSGTEKPESSQVDVPVVPVVPEKALSGVGNGACHASAPGTHPSTADTTPNSSSSSTYWDNWDNWDRQGDGPQKPGQTGVPVDPDPNWDKQGGNWDRDPEPSNGSADEPRWRV